MPNVGLLGGLVTAAQHHDHQLAVLDIVNAPAWPEMFAHLENAFAYRFYVAQVAKLDLAQPLDEALPCQPVLQAFEPVGELIELFHRVDHKQTVIE